MDEHRQDEKLLLKALVLALNRAIGPKYRAVIVGDPLDITPAALAQAVAVECVTGEEPDSDEIESLMNAFMADGGSPFIFTEDVPPFVEDDLMVTFDHIVHEMDISPEIEMFQAELLDHYRLAHGAVGSNLYEMIKLLKHAGVDQEVANRLMKLANDVYHEGADMQAFTVSRLVQWDQTHESPSSIVLAGRTKALFDDEEDGPVEEVVQERLMALYRLKHHWRYHQSNFVSFDKRVFEGLWNDPDT